MNNSQLDRILRLVRRTGEKCVVFDRADDAGMVVMGLDEYEKMLDADDGVSDLSESDLLDKINRDIAVWRDKHDSGDDVDRLNWDLDTKETVNTMPEIEPVPEPELAPLEAEKPLDLAEPEGEDAAGAADEEVNLTDIPHDGEEEKFYLEPVE